MREGWEYKKLGEVCEIYQPRTLSTDMLTDTGDYPVYGANGIIGYYNQYNHEDKEVLLTCRGATCGTINISKPYSWINGNAMVIHRKSEEMFFDYLKYLMLSIDYSFIITGAAQPQITRQKLAPTKIGIPSKSTQLAIVSELDKINELIRLKKEQLKDFDNLAQSIFYEMFGDPVENEKGWETKRLGDVCIYPANRLPISEIKPQNYVGVENLQKNRAGIIFSEKLPNINSATEFILNDILIGNIR
ncbi:restriction endonuclease subunit S, partial [Prevotellamassilia timonensis]|uniref:restriction endonuclease subunit S n=1 Tax=Prevotellamassilia timonensis TaxID=1852370 RepID=UPI00307A6097